MLIVERMLFKDLLWSFILALVGVNSLLVLEPLIRFAKKAVGASIGFFYMLKIGLLIQPKVLVFSLPLALVIAIVSTYGRLNVDNELIIMRVSGVTVKRIFKPGLFFVVSVLAVALIFAHWAGPRADRTLRLSLNKLIRDNLFAAVESQVFFQKIKGLTIFVRAKEGDILKDVFVFQDADPPRVITADTARWTGPQGGGIVFENGHILLPRGKEILNVSFKRYQMGLGMPEGLIGLSRASMTDRQLLRNYRDTRRRIFMTEFLRRFSLPLVNLPLGLLAMVFSVKAGHGARMRGFFMVVGVFGAYYALLLLTENLVLSGHAGVYLSLLPVVTLTAIAIFLYRRIRE